MVKSDDNGVKKIIAYIPEKMWEKFREFLESEYGTGESGKLAHGAVSLGLRKAIGVFLESLEESKG